MGKHYRRHLALAGSLAASLAAQTVMAQTAGVADSANNDHADDIVVTAQRREQRLTDVPVAVQAVSAAAIEKNGSRNIVDLMHLTPNVNISNPTGLSGSIQIRGVGSSSRNIGFDARVGVYVDGVYTGQSTSLNQELLDLDHVEVLRGPQGALFGKNTVAGAISLVTKKPGRNFEGELIGELSNYDGRFVGGSVNVPLGSTTAMRVAASFRQRDGYVDNVNPPYTSGRYAGGAVKDFSTRGQFRWQPDDRFDAILSVDALRARDHNGFSEAITNTNGNAATPIPPSDYSTSYNYPYNDFRNLYGAALNATYSLGDDMPSIVSITAYRTADLRLLFDTDYSPADLLRTDYHDKYKQFSQEVQLVSPGSGPFQYIIGAIYYWQKGEADRKAILGAAGTALGAVGGAATNKGTVTVDNPALYGNFTYEFVPKLELGVGFRWSREKKVADWAINGAPIPATGIATGQLNRSRVDNDFSPTATLTYKITPRVSAYARYATGYKSGGYNLEYVGAAVFPGNLEFRKEKVKNYELGIKGQIDGGATFDLTLFQADFSDFQISQLRDLGGGRSGFAISNAASVRSRGIEFSGSVRPVDGLVLSVGGALLDAKFSNFPGGGTGGVDVTGNKLPYAPDISGNVAIDYKTALGNSDLSLLTNLVASYNASQFTTADNLSTRLAGTTPVSWGRVNGYVLVDGRIGIEHRPGAWTISAFARNLLNRKLAVNYGSDFFGTLLKQMSQPRVFGVEVRKRF